jgi:hypothetical protein
MKMQAALVILYATSIAAGCSDSAGPDNQTDPGRFTIQVRGPTNLHMEGQAEVYPGLGSGTIERFNFVTATTAIVYRLEIVFAPALPSPSGSFAVGSGSPARATFFVFDRNLNDYAQIAPAQSGTLSLEDCTLARCVGTLTGQFALGSTVQLSTITAAFHARLQ